MRQLRVVVVVLLALAATALASAPAHAASIWTPIASGATADITGIEYQSDSRFWFVTSAGEIYTRQPGGSFLRTFGPSAVPLNDIHFQTGGGQIGIAVGNSGQVLRSTNGGASWTNVNTGPAIPVSQGDTTFADCTSQDPLGDVYSVRFAGNDRVWIMGQGAQLARSAPATVANVGAAGTWVDANWNDTTGNGRTADDTCRVATSYGSGLGDAFWAAPDVGYFCTTFFGEIFFTANNLGSSATKKSGDCGNGTSPQRRIAGDAGNPNRMWAVSPGGEGTSFAHVTRDGWSTSANFTIANPDAHAFGTPYDVAFAGGTVVAVGDGGTVVNSIDGTNFFHNPADGSLATTGWRAVSLASGSQAAIGGTGGTLAISTQANTVPDLVAPAGTIAGPIAAVAGQPATYTANVADNAGGSGINPASFSWTSTGLPNATGNPVSLTFPSAGYYVVNVRFTDNAGNAGTASLGVTVSAAATVPPPVIPAVVNKTTTVSVSGGTVTLKSPKSCVPVGSRFTVTMSFKRKTTSRTGKVIKILQVVFYIDGKKKVTDKKAPFAQRLTVKSFKAGSTHKLKARATMKVRHGKPPTKSIQTTFKVCG